MLGVLKLLDLPAMCASLFVRAFIFSTALFQLVNGLVVHTPPVHSSDCPDVLQSLQNATSQSASYSQPRKVFFPPFWIFPAAATSSMILQSLLQKFRFTNTGFLSWRSFYLFFTATITTTATRRDQCRCHYYCY